MPTFIRTDSIFTDSSIPVLKDDPSLDIASALFLYDLLSKKTWPSQTGTTNGTLIDIADKANAAVAGTLDWEKGLLFSEDVATDKITLPASSKFDTAINNKLAMSFWITPKITTSGYFSIACCGEGSGYTNTQFVIVRNSSTIELNISGSIVGGSIPVVVGVPIQLGIVIEKSGANYKLTAFKNGVQHGTITKTSLNGSGSQTAALVGVAPSVFSNTDKFSLHRVHADKLTTRTATQFFADDYNAGNGRFN